MRKLARNIRALGTPVANLIVLMSAVILSVTVTFFAMNVTTSQVQKESLYISRTHLWYVNTTYSTGAVIVTNTGPTDVVLSKIVVKGLECSWNGTDSFIVYNKTSSIPQGDLPFLANLTNSEDFEVALGNGTYTFGAAGDDLTLKAGWTMMCYLALPERLMVYDIGLPVRIVISTAQAVYCTETMVQTS
ncbi:MAG: hypothetical protein ACE14S_08925 [Candidatus Bathyarchaeia archaeon]